MTKEEFAKKLDGREYREEITREEAAEAKKNNLVVVFGASDDLMEFRGAIYDEIGVWEGGVVSIDKNGLITNQCDNEFCPYFLALKESATKIAAIWNPPEYAHVSWEYKTYIPHAKFSVMEDGKVYCRGIVFSLDDVR